MKNHVTLKKIDNYYLDQSDVLGKGAYSVVYKGVNIQNNNPVAIKTVKLLESNLQVELARREIQHLQLIDHENVVKLMDVKKSQTNLYLIMEYCNGGNLDGLLKRNHGRLVECDAIKVFKDIVMGMQSLTENGMVHRDLKPANILIHNFSAKVADFGFSKLLDSESMMTSFVGTPQYMSPQQLRNEPYSNKSDVWSLGIILYEMLYGTPPFTGATQAALLNDIEQRKPHFPDFPKLVQALLVFEEKDRMNLQQLFAHELINETYQDRLKHSLESLSKLENSDHIRKSKELSKIFFEENSVVTSYIECLKRENLNKVIVNQHLQQNNMINDMSQLAQRVQQCTVVDPSDEKDVATLLEQHRLTQENFHLFNEIASLLLHRRNKAVYFHLTAIYLYEVYFEEQSATEISKDLMIRLVYLLLKYAMGKLYKTYKSLKTPTPQRSDRFLPKQWELFMRTEQRTHLLNFISFDFEMCQLFHDVFMKYVKALLTKTLQDNAAIEQEPEGAFDIIGLLSPPNLFTQEFEYTGSEIQQVPLENIQMIKTFLRHCGKKLRPKVDFDPVLDGTIKLTLYQVPNLTSPTHKLLLNLVRARYACLDWRKSLRYQGTTIWSKFDESLRFKTKEQLYQKIA